MIVRQFLHWVRNAPAADRSEASGNLARAYLYSDLSPDDRAAAEGALIMLLDDPSPLVRAELSRALAFSENAPAAVIHGLAADQPEIATWVLEHSPLLVDADLVDAVAIGTPEIQIAIARRVKLPCAVAAAVAEVGAAEACLVLVENLEAEIAPFSLDRIVDRFGHLPVDPQVDAAARRPAGGDPPGTGREALAPLVSFVDRAGMAGAGPRPARRARGLREGHPSRWRRPRRAAKSGR